MPSVRLISALSANCCLTNVRLNKGIVNQNLVKNEKKNIAINVKLENVNENCFEVE